MRKADLLTRHDPAPRRAAAASIAAALLLLVLLAPVAAAQDPSVAPAASLSDGGRTASAGGMVLQASQVDDLDPAGQPVTVRGGGYDEAKGVYVTFCVVPPPGHPPAPCGGGQDRAGDSGASTWISSDPPDYAAGLTTPYGPGGSFTTTLVVEPVIAEGVDCRIVRCAIVTRADHTRSADRSQDLLLPVTFRSSDQPAPSQPSATLPPEPTTTTAPPAPTAVAPVLTVAANGRSVTDGTRTLAASDTDGLDPEAATVTVNGFGFDGQQGLYVALCAVPAPGAAPGPCTAGADAARWVSSNPPDYGRDRAMPFGDGGTFEVELLVSARIDADTDCRTVPCAIATRSDDTAPADRRNDLLLPVTFADRGSAETTTTAGGDADRAVTVSDRDDGGSNLAGPALGGAGVLVAAVAGALLLRNRRRPPGAAPVP